MQPNIFTVNQYCGIKFIKRWCWTSSDAPGGKERMRPDNGLISSLSGSILCTGIRAADPHLLLPLWTQDSKSVVRMLVSPICGLWPPQDKHFQRHIFSSHFIIKVLAIWVLYSRADPPGCLKLYWPACGRGRINKLKQALHENNTDQFNIDAKEWRA